MSGPRLTNNAHVQGPERSGTLVRHTAEPGFFARTIITTLRTKPMEFPDSGDMTRLRPTPTHPAARMMVNKGLETFDDSTTRYAVNTRMGVRIKNMDASVGRIYPFVASQVGATVGVLIFSPTGAGTFWVDVQGASYDVFVQVGGGQPDQRIDSVASGDTRFKRRYYDTIRSLTVRYKGSIRFNTNTAIPPNAQPANPDDVISGTGDTQTFMKGAGVWTPDQLRSRTIFLGQIAIPEGFPILGPIIMPLGPTVTALSRGFISYRAWSLGDVSVGPILLEMIADPAGPVLSRVFLELGDQSETRQVFFQINGSPTNTQVGMQLVRPALTANQNSNAYVATLPFISDFALRASFYAEALPTPYA